ncbi:MAG: hypothetical protein U5K84_06680 [Alkalibacterium sp.]|nr:hypothetical protein [Alkalibacterium sp.]
MSSELARDMRVELEDSGEGIKVFKVNEDEETYELIFHVQRRNDFKFLFGFGREHDEVELDVPYLMTLDNVPSMRRNLLKHQVEPAPDEEDGEWVEIGHNLIKDGTLTTQRNSAMRLTADLEHP